MIELNKEELLASLWELKDKKVGYVAIVWRPNVWKSTFINALIGEKVSIVSSVPQTTRKRVLAIHNDDESQIIFFDTPWIHHENKVFNETINKEAITSLNTSNAILYFIDTTREWGEEERYIKELLSKVKVPVIKVYTKTDLKAVINIPEKGFKISSTKETGFEDLLDEVKKHLKVDKILYPEEYYTASDVNFRISEVIREKVFLNTGDELPHSSYVEVEEYEDKWDLLRIVAYVFTETDSQRYIMIWKWGKLVSKIGKEARLELEKLYDKKVFLALRVKTAEKWRKNEKIIKKIFK